MTNARGKTVDNTHLSIDTAEQRGFLHRDYIAHCLRWSHVCKFLMLQQRYKTARILDIGCGKELPLAKLMFSSRMAPSYYCGIDVNKLVMPETFAKTKWQPTELLVGDAAELKPEDMEEVPNIVVCFEVLEHVEPDHCRRILANLHNIVDPDADIFLSTPCWDLNVGAAANHVNEMKYEAFGAVIEDSDFRIEGHWGTFASIRDYQDDLQRDGYGVLFEKMRAYYDTNYLATIFAPLYPHRARNCLWHIKPGLKNTPRLFNTLVDYQGPWGSSEHWERMKP